MIIDPLNCATQHLHLAAGVWRPNLTSSATLLLAAAVGAAFIVMSQLLCNSRRAARRCYWLGWIVTSVLLTFSVALSDRPLRIVILTAVLCIFFAVGFAYFGGWQLRIAGQTRSVFVKNTYADPPVDGSDVPPPPPPPANSYNGVVTADGFWWIAAILTAVIAADVYLFGWVWQSILGAMALTIMGALAGADDASRGLQTARGQRVQAVVATVASIPLWMLPAVAYAAGYQYGKRRPLRRFAQRKRYPRQ